MSNQIFGREIAKDLKKKFKLIVNHPIKWDHLTKFY